MYVDSLIFRINRVVRAVEVASGMSELDHKSRSILTFIADAELRRRVVRVTDVTKVADFGTAPTVYAHIRKLEGGGWIRCVPDPNDGRVKRLLLTSLARNAFAKMSFEARTVLARKAKN